MSDVSSAGSHGKTCRQDVLCRIHVPVMAGAAGRTSPESQVYTDRVSRRIEGAWRLDVDLKGHVPPTVRVLRNDHHRRVERRRICLWPGRFELERLGGLREAQRAVIHAERRAGEVSGLASASALESRQTRSSGEETPLCGALVAQRLLEGRERYLRKESELFSPLPSGQRRIGLSIRSPLVARLETGFPVGERFVPHETHASEGAIQHRSLLGRRIGPTFVCGSHRQHHTGDA